MCVETRVLSILVFLFLFFYSCFSILAKFYGKHLPQKINIYFLCFLYFIN